MTALVWTVFVASLMGSLHCAGMCGPLVAFATGSASRRGVAAHGAYHVGRGGVYLILGAVAGGVGAIADLAGRALGRASVAVVIAGTLMATFGLVTLLRLLGVRVGGHASGAPRLLRAVTRHLQGRSTTLRSFVMGAVTPLLPCGWLWAFVAVAAGSGSVLGGTVLMGVFWLGTIPALAAVGIGVTWLLGRLDAAATGARTAQRLRRALPAVAAVALVVVGLSTAFGRLGRMDAVSTVSTATAAEPVPTAPVPSEACCHDAPTEAP